MIDKSQNRNQSDEGRLTAVGGCWRSVKLMASGINKPTLSVSD